MATDENTLTDEQRVEKEAEKTKLEQEIEELERQSVKLGRKMDVILARHTTDMFKDSVGQGLMVSAQKRLMDAEVTLRLANDDTYQTFLEQSDSLRVRIRKLDAVANRLYRELHPDDPYGFSGDDELVGDFED